MKSKFVFKLVLLSGLVFNSLCGPIWTGYAQAEADSKDGVVIEDESSSQYFSKRDSQGSLTIEEYKRLDATSLAEMVRSGRTTSQELIELAFQVIEETNPELNNVISTRKEEAIQEASEMVDEGQPFYGVPILVKGLGHTLDGGISSQGLSFLKEAKASEDGKIVKAFKKAGFVVVGQSSFPQMGWINVTNSELYGNTHNPWNLNHNPGGSSGGSSAAVAIGQVPIATTSDGGGSTRIPASWSGLIGLHPSRNIMVWDEISEYNTVTNFAETKTMKDTINLFEAMLKDELRDQVLEGHFDQKTPIAYTTKTPAGTPISDEAVKAVEAVVQFLEGKGYQLEEVDYPIDGEALMKQYYVLASSVAFSLSSSVNEILGRPLQIEDVERLTWGLYQMGEVLESEDMEKAWAHIDQVSKDLDSFYQRYPIFLTPTNAYPAPAADYNHLSPEMAEKLADMSKLTKEEKLQLIYDQWLPAWTLTPYTQLANLTGTPAISLPTHLTEDKLPLGVMFSTHSNNDRSLLEIGKLIEEEMGLKTYYNQSDEEKIDRE